MSLRPPNLGMRNSDRKRVSLPRCPIRTWDCERPLAVEYVRPMRRNIFCMKILLAILLLSPVELLAQSPFDGTWAIVSDTTMFTEVDTVSADGGTLTQLVRDTTEAQAVTIETFGKRIDTGPADSHTISGSWQAYKRVGRRTGRQSLTDAPKMGLVQRPHLAKSSTRNSTGETIPSTMTLFTQWSR